MKSEEVKQSIEDAAYLLLRKSEEIANDFEKEKITEVSILMNIGLDDCPTMSVERRYVCPPRP